jgi:hypothetical protein
VGALPSRASPLAQGADTFSRSKRQLFARDAMTKITSLRFDDGGCAAMTPAKCEAFCASPTSFRHHAAQRRSHGVIRQKADVWNAKRHDKQLPCPTGCGRRG